MNGWNILEIPYDSDLKTIKKAYAKLLKIHNPEDDAKGYQILREEYDQAIKYAKKNQKNANLELNNKEINEFLNKLNTIYNNVSLRIDPKVWEDLLNANVIKNVDNSTYIEDEIFKFLLSHKYLPSKVRSMLNDTFSWRQNKRKLSDKYSESIVYGFLKDLKAPDNLKYDYLGSINSALADKYLYFRQQAYEAMQEKYTYKAERNLFSAYDIYKYDAELLKLIGSYYYAMKNFNKALDFYRQAFEINNYDLDNVLLIGDVLLASERFSEAIPYYKLCLSSNQDNPIILENIGYCYYYGDNLEMAKESFIRLLNFQGDNKRIKKYLKNIESKLERKNVITIKFKKKKVVYNHDKIQENKFLEHKGEKRIAIIMSIVLAALIFSFSIAMYIQANNMAKITATEKENKNFTNIDSINELSLIDMGTNIKIYLKNVKSIKYYKTSEPIIMDGIGFNIFSENDLNEEGLWDKVETQMYMGEYNGTMMFFTDQNCSDKTIDKDGGYEVKGSVCILYNYIDDYIINEYGLDYYNDYKWENMKYIDASQKEIDKAKRSVELIKQRGKEEIKFIETAQDFKDSNFFGNHSVKLTNIVPLDVYLFMNSEGKFNFCNKREIEEKNINKDTYIQAYLGTIDDLNVIFVDSNFSKNSTDSDGGYTVEGEKSMIEPEKLINMTTEDGQSVNKNDVYNYYIQNTDIYDMRKLK